MSRRSIHWCGILFVAATVSPSGPLCNVARLSPKIALSREWGSHSARGLSSEAERAVLGS